MKTKKRKNESETLFARDPGHLDEIVRDLREKFSDIIKDIEVTLIIKEYKWKEFPGRLD